MDNSTTRNKRQAQKIESWLLNQIALRGVTNVAKQIGVDKSSVTRWKEQFLPRMAMLLAVLEWGVVDEDMQRLAKEVALLLTNKARSNARVHDDQISMNF